MKILYLGRKIDSEPTNGGDYGGLRNKKMLVDLYGEDNIDFIEIPKVSALRHLINIIFRRGYGETCDILKKIHNLAHKKYDFSFVDGSNYGRYADYLARNGCKVIVFFHNVEYDYYSLRYQATRKLQDYLFKKYIHYNERLAVNNAHTLIALNERDATQLYTYYKTHTQLLLPVFFPSISETLLMSSCLNNRVEYVLFVGASPIFNVEGISWFIKNVAPRIKQNVYVAGSCCNLVKKWFSQDEYPNVKLLGFVDNLEELYVNASAVVCPIFSGSGMKTKTIEALRYGKTVFGTSEAFEGIKVDFGQVGGLCNTAEEYISGLSEMKRNTFNEYSYEVFRTKYSDKAVYETFNRYILENFNV